MHWHLSASLGECSVILYTRFLLFCVSQHESHSSHVSRDLNGSCEPSHTESGRYVASGKNFCILSSCSLLVVLVVNVW